MCSEPVVGPVGDHQAGVLPAAAGGLDRLGGDEVVGQLEVDRQVGERQGSGEHGRHDPTVAGARARAW